MIALEWIQEESSESDDFILVESRKKKREKRRGIVTSPISKGMIQDQESLGLVKKRS